MQNTRNLKNRRKGKMDFSFIVKQEGIHGTEDNKISFKNTLVYFKVLAKLTEALDLLYTK